MSDSAVERLRALVLARELLGEAIDQAVAECDRCGVDRTTVAGLLGVHRSTLYRRLGSG